MHKVIIELSLKFIFIFIFEILLVHKTGELDNKAKTTHFFFDSIIKTRLLRWEIPPPHLKLTLTSMEINKSKNKRKDTT